MYPKVRVGLVHIKLMLPCLPIKGEHAEMLVGCGPGQMD